MALVTAAEVRAQIKELSGDSMDSALDVLIARFEAMAARWCGYPPATAGATPTFSSTSYTLYLTGSGGREVVFPVRPVTAVASVYDDPDGDWGATTLVSSGDYAIFYDPLRGQTLRLTSTATHGSWSSTPGAIKVSLTAGYSSAPADLKAAVEYAVRNLFDLRGRRSKLSESAAAGGSVQFTDEELMPEQARLLLAPLRLPLVAAGVA